MNAVMGFAVWPEGAEPDDENTSIATLYCPPCFIEKYMYEAEEVMNEYTTDYLCGGGEQPVLCSVCSRRVN